MDERSVLEALRDAVEGGRTVALATVVAARGSTPRGPGSRMVVDPERGVLGTIGGGCGEADVLAAAPQVLRSRQPRLIRVELMDAVDSWSPAVCGGTMDVFLEPVGPEAAAGGEA